MCRNILFLFVLSCVATFALSTFGQESDDENRERTADERDRDDRNNREDRGGRGGRGDRGGGRGDRRGENSGDAPRGEGGRPSRPEPSVKSDGKSAVRTGSARTGKKKTAASLTLPSQYIAKDGNRDGQIGMYEWSQVDLSTFKKLDINGDGFLVPSEFANPGIRSSGTATITPTIAATSGSSSSNSTAGSTRDRPGSGGLKPSEVKPSQPSADPLISEGESAFGLRDLNKDNQLDQDEFDGSVRIKRVFEKAKLTFAGPMPKDKFLEVYREALLAKDAKK